MKPLKLPGEKDPTQAISTCPKCNSCVDQKAQRCQNCGETIVPQWGSPHPRKVPAKGERFEEYGPKLDYVSNITSVSASKEARRKKDKDIAEHNPETVLEEYRSDEFNMCTDQKRKNRVNVDVRKEEIMRSCTDLAIDG